MIRRILMLLNQTRRRRNVLVIAQAKGPQIARVITQFVSGERAI